MEVMFALHISGSIRHPSRVLVRWVLACFALSCLTAIAAPLMQSQGATLVCTSAGEVRWVNAGPAPVGNANISGQDTDAGMVAGHHTLDCVLCLPLLAPPNARPALHAKPQTSDASVAHVDALIPHTGFARPVARGPPTTV
jgi:hypothetical protein